MGRLDKADWVGIAGTFLVLSSVGYLLWSADKNPAAQAGHVVTGGIGIALLTIRVCS